MLLSIRVPATNERGPLYMDQVLAAIHQANPWHLPLTLAFTQQGGHVGPCLVVPDELWAILEAQLYAAYPDCKIERSPEVAAPPNGQTYWTAEFEVERWLFPIKRYPQFEDPINRTVADPLTAILATLTPDKRNPLQARIEILVRPARAKARLSAERVLRRLARPFFREHTGGAHVYMTLALSHRLPCRFLGWMLGRLAKEGGEAGGDPLHTSGSRLHEREHDLQAAGDKLGRLLFEAQIRITVIGPHCAAARARERIRAVAGAFGQFSVPRLASFHLARVRGQRKRPRRFRSPPFLLSTEELATIWHPPTATVRAPTMRTVESREFEPPVELPTPDKHLDLAVLGVTAFRSLRHRFGILPDDRRRHLMCLGKTGMGKSSLLHQLIASDIRAGRGVGVIDPHGDLAEAVLHAIPGQRTNEVVLFDAGDSHPIAFNPLSCRNPAERPLVASAIVSAFKKLYADSWGPRLEHIFRNALLALLEVPGSSLLSVLRLLSDARYRQQVVSQVRDPVVHSFWEREFAAMHAKLQTEAIAPIQNKVGQFASSPILRNIIGQPHSRLDLREIMDEGRVLIVNLSKGRIGDDASALLGSFLVSSLQLAAMSRADLPEAQRRDFFLYVDEFQNFATDSFADILSQARKYRLNLTIANQFLAQMPETTLAAVFGNIGTLICFQVGAQDAEVLAEQLGGDLAKRDLLQLPRYHAYARVLIDGMPSRPFSIRTLPPSAARHDAGRPAIVRRTSRQRYARPAQLVERQIQQALAAL